VKKPDPYQFHRIALAPVLPGATEKDIESACIQAESLDEDDFLNFLMQQGLAPMWDKALEKTGASGRLSQQFRDSLHQARLHTTGTYLIHKNKLTLIREILEGANIPYVVYKGADTRERYYSEPSLRPAADIDLLVPSDHKIAVTRAFKEQGFNFYGAKENISHEANLVKGNTSIDLHWDIMRPGRTRRPMVDILLDTRQDCGSHWGMSDEGNLFVLLVHPVFTKYSTSPQATLMRTVDLAHILAGKEWELGKLVQLLDMAGLKTAAWITLRWLKLITNTTLGDSIIEAVKPGTLRRKYLLWWLEKNLATRLLDRPWLIQLGFTLPAHDKTSDALRAIRYIRKAADSASSDLQTIEESIV
jgi:Uncharacterised nucleotidyltransferase